MRTTAAATIVVAGVASTLASVAPAQAAVTLSTPQHLSVTSASATTLSLDWAPVAGASGYRVQLSRSSTMSHPSYVPFTADQGTLTGLTPGQRYFVRVAVVSPVTGARLSAYTKSHYPSGATKAVAVPTSVRATGTTSSSVALSWEAPEGATTYQLKRSTSSGFATATYSRSSSPAATLAGLATGQSYYVKVRVIRSNAVPLTAWTPTVRVATAVPTEPTPTPTPVPTPPPVPTPTPTDDGPVDVRVGSYNVSSVSLDTTSGEERPWAQRRTAVISNVMSQRLDVLGVQEINQSTFYASRLVDGDTQVKDLTNGLNQAGGSFAPTNPNSYNCANPSTGYNCVRQDQGASGSNRILYNTATLQVVRVGAFTYDAQLAGTNDDSMAWAVLRSRANGDDFLFTSTHLEPRSGAVKAAQWRETLADIAKIKGDLPVVSVGDYNTNKYSDLAEQMYPGQKAAGIGDVLNQEFQVNPARGVRAENLVNAWISSLNRFSRDVSSFSYATSRTKIGNVIDQIFATNALVVKEYEVVVPFDPRTLQQRGVIGSDHNLVRATIQLP